MLSRIRGTDIGIYLYDDDTELCEELIVGADITVDAVFGTGFKGAADEKNARIFKAISKSLGNTVSIDIPSGIEADSGYVKGAAVKAQMTIAVMGAEKFTRDIPGCGIRRQCYSGTDRYPGGNIQRIHGSLHPESR